ncbi:DNA ligase (ATP) DNL4, partial [Ascoidea rubescens DSM 1968]
NSHRLNLTDQKKAIISKFYENWRKNVGNDIYPVIRLAVPKKETDRLYNIRETVLINLVLKVFNLNKNSDENRLLKNWKNQNANFKFNKYESLITLITTVITQRQSTVNGSEITIDQLNDYLDKLAFANLSQDDKIKIFSDLFNKLNSLEIKYFLKIILKTSVVQNTDTLFLSCWHPDALDYYSVACNLEKLCHKLLSPSKRLNQKELLISINQPFFPELASKPIKFNEITKKFDNQFIIETKLDGERSVVHISQDSNGNFKFKFFTRHAKDYTYLFGDDIQFGTFSKYFKEIFKKDINKIKNLILDGEMLSYDINRNVILPLGYLKSSLLEETFKLEKLQTNQRDQNNPNNLVYTNSRPLYVIFDILLLNDQPIYKYRLKERKKLLNELINPKPGYIEIIETENGATVKDIENSLKNAIENNLEGIVVKDINSRYKANERSPDWIKVKPEYLEEFGDNVDVLIIGKINSKKPSFICGLRVDDSESKKFISFCSVSNGISESDLKEIESLTYDKWYNYREDLPPTDIIEFSKKIPDFWIKPEDSIVFEIKARSIENGMVAKDYVTDSTLYNLYMKSIRRDKSCKDCLSYEEYLEIKLIKDSIADKRKNRQTLDNNNENFSNNIFSQLIGKKKERKRKRNESDDEEDEFFYLSLESDIFAGYCFNILSDYKFNNHSRRVYKCDIEKIVRRNGGEITKSENVGFTENKNLVSISNISTRNTNLLFEKGYDILSPKWIMDCVKHKKILSLEPQYCYKVHENVLKEINSRVDEFGDSYFLQTEVAQFHNILK